MCTVLYWYLLVGGLDFFLRLFLQVNLEIYVQRVNIYHEFTKLQHYLFSLHFKLAKPHHSGDVLFCVEFIEFCKFQSANLHTIWGG